VVRFFVAPVKVTCLMDFCMSVPELYPLRPLVNEAESNESPRQPQAGSATDLTVIQMPTIS
jgi:hypothetical protein